MTRRRVESKVVVPQNGDNTLDMKKGQVSPKLTGQKQKTKRSRSEGDGSKDADLDLGFLKERKSRSPRKRLFENKQDNVESTQKGEKSSDESKMSKSKRSRSRSKSRQPSSGQQSPSSEHSRQGSTAAESSERDTEEEDEYKPNKFRKDGRKFTVERQDYRTNKRDDSDMSYLEESDAEDFDNFGVQPTDSEVVFKHTITGKGKDKEPKKRKRKHRSKSRDRRRGKKERDYYSSRSTSDSSDEEYYKRKYKRKRRSPRKEGRRRKRKYITSDSESEDERVSKIIMQVVEKLNKTKEFKTPKESLHKKGKSSQQQVAPNQSINIKVNKETTPIKSPSEPTIYTPGLQMGLDRNVDDRFIYNPTGSPVLLTPQAKQQVKSNDRVMAATCGSDQEGDPGPEFINQFINSVRIGETKKRAEDERADLQKDRRLHSKGIADKAIIEAEKYKATLQHPEGMNFSSIQKLRMLDNDDDFFHIICHIDPQLMAKIQKGEYVDLAKLLQKPESLAEEEAKINLLSKDGQEYLVRNKNNTEKITNVRRWEQAFRTYTAIYCEANPERSVEILQYIDVINQAAAKFNWYSVARYDYVFRHLMAKKPYRSWAKTYTQGWTLILTGDGGHNSSKQLGFQGRLDSLKKGDRDWRDNCCWKFNKTESCPYGKNCRFDHRCTYCGSYGHGSSNCHRKGRRSTDSTRTHEASEPRDYSRKGHKKRRSGGGSASTPSASN